ncbi:hypothetical protein, partial [Streptococcus acidominimus]
KDLVLAVWRAFDRRAVSAGLNLKSVGFIFLLYHVSLFFIEYKLRKRSLLELMLTNRAYLTTT